MRFLSDLSDGLQAFMDAGGPVLWAILLLSLVLWSLIVERLLYFRHGFPVERREWIVAWYQRRDRHSRAARNIRRATLSMAKIRLQKSTAVIGTLVALCPILGLLGTVTGMIHVFDVMAVMGTGNTRAMASGVSRATIPTMAGMVIAISALYFSKRIDAQIDREIHYLSDRLSGKSRPDTTRLDRD